MLLRASRDLTASEGRDYVIPDDVKGLALPVMGHRVIVSADAVMNGRTPEAVVGELLQEVPVPIRGKT